MDEKNAEIEAAEIIEKVEKSAKKEEGLINLSTGVVLRAKQVPPLTLMAIASKYTPPKVPMYFNESYGRDMENPSDEDYQDRKRDYQIRMSNLMMNAFIFLGTEFVKKPKNVPGPDSNTWVQDLEVIGLDTRPDLKSWRYIHWVKNIAAKSNDDMKKLMKEVGRLSGSTQKDVDAAVETFQGDERPS